MTTAKDLDRGYQEPSADHRQREAMTVRSAEALLQAVRRTTRAASPIAGLRALLQSARESLGCAAVAVLAAEGAKATVQQASDSGLVGGGWQALDLLQSQARRAPDMPTPAGAEGKAPSPLAAFQSLLSVPIAAQEGEARALVCLSRADGGFTAEDGVLLEHLADLVGHALETIALSERQALLAAVIEGSSASILIADARDDDLPLLYVNSAFRQLTGYDEAEVLGRNGRFLSAEPRSSPERSRLRAAIAARRSGEFELLNRRKDGTTFWNKVRLFPIVDETGAVRYMAASQTDASERREIERERDQATARLADALTSMSEGVLLVDAAGRIAFANERFRSFFAPAKSAWQAGDDFVEVWTQRLKSLGVSPAAAEKAAAERRDRLFVGEEETEEHLPDGRIVLVNDRATPEGGAVSIATDVTSIKETERQLAERMVAIDATHDGIAIADLNGRFVYMNPSHLSMFGYEREEEVLGLPWSILYRQEQADYIVRVAMPDLQRHGTWRGEIAGLRKDGSCVRQEISLTLLQGVGFVSVTRDVSERQRNERERARLTAELDASQRRAAIGQIAAGISHDFNNLLSAISGSASLLLKDIDDAAKVRQHAERILAAGGRAGALISRLLDLGARRGETRRLDLREPFAEAADLLRSGNSERIAFSASPGDAPLFAQADPTDILQVALNLAINGRDAIRETPGEVQLSLSLARPEQLNASCQFGSLDRRRRYALLQCSDTGHGIEAETLQRIFEPYFTTKGKDGTGLGLAVVSGIVKAVGGAIRVESRIGEGTDFLVFWPIEGAGEAAPPAGREEEGTVSLAGLTVLAVDDVSAVAQVIAGLLETQGAEVAACEDPRDALAAVVEDPEAWKLLITDYDMPGMTGAQLAREVRAIAPDMPILLCTALAAYRGKSDAPEGLFDGVVSKPVSRQSLIAAARAAILARRQQARPS